jgi:hypothetical protein
MLLEPTFHTPQSFIPDTTPGILQGLGYTHSILEESVFVFICSGDQQYEPHNHGPIVRAMNTLKDILNSKSPLELGLKAF